MKPAVLPLDDIYAPIAEHLRAVEQLFDEELECDLPFTAEICEHVSRYRGKMLRPALTLLAAQACGRISREHVTIAAVLEMVHLATLVHDDVLDEAETRRRSPTINAMTDNETAVLVGDYLISHAYHLCSSLDSQYASRTVASCTNTVCEGELLQVHERDNWALTQEQYLTIISRKTASLISIACMLGAKYAGADAATINAMESYGMDTGVAFQIVDDILDLVGSEEQLGKTLGLDLDKGKVTLPIIHYLESADRAARRRLRELCANPSDQTRAEIRDLLADSLAYAMNFANQRVQSALACTDRLLESPARNSLRAMAEFIVQRRY